MPKWEEIKRKQNNLPIPPEGESCLFVCYSVAFCHHLKRKVMTQTTFSSVNFWQKYLKYIAQRGDFGSC